MVPGAIIEGKVGKFIILEDGSIKLIGGPVCVWSDIRFNRLLTTDELCFVCGRSRQEIDFTDEHILPKWLIRTFDLRDKFIRLPNGSKVPYYRYRVPSCNECNSKHLSRLERHVAAKLTAGAKDPTRKILDSSIYVWLALLQFKLGLKDHALKWSNVPANAEGSIAFAAGLPSEILRITHSLVRCYVFNFALSPSIRRTYYKFPVHPLEPNNRFDLLDFQPAQAIALRLGQIALLAAFADGGKTRPFLDKHKDNIFDASSIREMAIRFAVLQHSLLTRPRYFTEFDASYSPPVHYNCDTPNETRFAPFDVNLCALLRHRNLSLSSERG